MVRRHVTKADVLPWLLNAIYPSKCLITYVSRDLCLILKYVAIHHITMYRNTIYVGRPMKDLARCNCIKQRYRLNVFNIIDNNVC